jgi:hypothetical protein
MKSKKARALRPKRAGSGRECVCREEASVTRGTSAATKLAARKSNSVQTT